MCVNAGITLMLRAVINDLDSESYTDERLEQLIVVAAKFVNADLESSYVISINGPDITPDPIEQSDDMFVNLLVMRAACLVDSGNLRVRAALAGLQATAGPAMLKVGGENFSAYKAILEMGPCALYRQMLQDYKLGSGAMYHGILSPFVSNTFDPESMNFYGGHLRD